MARTPASDEATPAPGDSAAPGAKGRATPTRKEREAARRRPLVPADRKLAARQSREQTAAAREKQRLGMAAGDEKYLPIRDKGPQKRFVRDYVDARWNVGEILLPLLVLVILTYFFEAVAIYALTAVWGVIAIVVIDCVLLGARLVKKLGAKFGPGKVERGVRWYATMRAIQLRPLRLPKPQVKRGQFPT